MKCKHKFVFATKVEKIIDGFNNPENRIILYCEKCGAVIAKTI